jgi:formate hydrogenlyase subunit 3/multisubunit Na+/H+ antiporter MnhD subunit
MSGVMTKVAIYAFIRVVFDLLGPPQVWWSVVVLLLGAATAVMGVLYALMQTDLKRFLAYSTVENVGIIFIGLGLALAFKAQNLALAAALAATAALFHAFNHSLFKSLLFMGAGAVVAATEERDMERMGGLISRMPQTALVFLVGAVAISALPPLNGFASEWLTFQAVLVSPQLAATALKFLVPAVGGLLALAAALTGGHGQGVRRRLSRTPGGSRPAAARPQPGRPPGRRRIMQRLRAGDPSPVERLLTTWSGSACASSLPRATPTFCWSPGRSA